MLAESFVSAKTEGWGSSDLKKNLTEKLQSADKILKRETSGSPLLCKHKKP